MNARGWAYIGVGLGFLASITANIASTVLKATEVPLQLRVPFAVFWPVATYVAIEVLVRTEWSASWSHRFVRLVLAGPVAVVAAFVSYLHQHHLMILAGEPGLAQGLGPIAVDSLLFGMTAVLILTRPGSATPVVEAAPESESVKSVVEVIEDAAGASQPIEPGIDWQAEFEALDKVTEDVPAPKPLPVPVSPAPRATRSRVDYDVRRVAELVFAGATPGEIIASVPGLTRTPAYRLVKVGRILATDPSAAISPAEKVAAEHVEILRDVARTRS